MSQLQISPSYSTYVGEYTSIVKAATREGWLPALLDAHWTPCDQADAIRLLDWAFTLTPRTFFTTVPAVDLLWRGKRGRARFNRRTARYGISLPLAPGTKYAHLRAGLVLHEAAHVIDRLRHGAFGHRGTFRRVLRRLFELDWRTYNVRTGNLREIYDRHRGPYSLLLTRAVPGKGGKIVFVTDRMAGPFSAEEAHELARMLVNDPRDNVTSAHVFSDSEGQFTGAYYKRGDEYESWGEMLTVPDLDAVQEEGDGGMELPDQRDETALLLERAEPLQPVDDPVEPVVPTEPVARRRPVRNVPAPEQAAAGAQRKRGVALELDPGNAERWPTSKGATVVRTALEGGLRGTASELAKALAADLTAAGVEFPASLISRLKQGGFLREVE